MWHYRQGSGRARANGWARLAVTGKGREIQSAERRQCVRTGGVGLRLLLTHMSRVLPLSRFHRQRGVIGLHKTSKEVKLIGV